jgi:hypothetical protein
MAAEDAQWSGGGMQEGWLAEEARLPADLDVSDKLKERHVGFYAELTPTNAPGLHAPPGTAGPEAAVAVAGVAERAVVGPGAQMVGCADAEPRAVWSHPIGFACSVCSVWRITNEVYGAASE